MMRWVGLNGGYVSDDGRFLVAQVTTQGRRGDVQKWALYGLVHFVSEDALHSTWGWTEQPIYGPKDTKRACQEWACSEGGGALYGAPEIRLDGGIGHEPSNDARPFHPVKRLAWEVCQECGVDYKRPQDHPYLDYCGKGCFEIVCERVEEIQGNLKTRRTAS